MRGKTVIANRGSQPFLLRGATGTCRPSHIASTATAEERTTNAPRRKRRKKDIRTLTVSMLLRQRSSRRSGHDRVPFPRERPVAGAVRVLGARYYLTVAQGKLLLTLAESDGSDEPMAE
jgi:hypothetical protein